MSFRQWVNSDRHTVTMANEGEEERHHSVTNDHVGHLGLANNPKSSSPRATICERLRHMVDGVLSLWVDGSGRFYYYWTVLVSVACLYNLTMIIARMTFEELSEFRQLWLALDFSSDGLFLIDILIHAKIGYICDGSMEVGPRAMLHNYMRSTRFRLDVFSVLPFDLLNLIWPGNVVLRINRLARCHRLSDFTSRTETRTSWPNTFRIGKLLATIFIVFHWNACLFYAISDEYDTTAGGKRQWQFQYGKIFNPIAPLCADCSYANDTRLNDTHNEQRMRDYWTNRTADMAFTNLTRQYVFSVYWSALILTTLGEQMSPLLLNQFVFVTIDILFGLLIFATIVGQVGEMVSNMNQAKTQFEAQQDGVKTFMEYRRVKPMLRDKIVHWFTYIWSQGQSLDEDAVVSSLPPKLKAELAIATHLDTLKRVKLFQDCEPGLLVELVLKLKLQVFSPDDYICRRGDVGKEMYIVRTGSLEVVSPDGKLVFVTLKEGAVFGELSILDIAGNKNGNKRTAGVRSVGYSDLFVLSKDDLWDALREYPEAKHMLLEKGRAILLKDGLLDDSAALGGQLASGPVKTAEQKLIHVQEMISVLTAGLQSLDATLREDTQTMKVKMTALERGHARQRRALRDTVLLP